MKTNMAEGKSHCIHQYKCNIMYYMYQYKTGTQLDAQWNHTNTVMPAYTLVFVINMTSSRYTYIYTFWHFFKFSFYHFNTKCILVQSKQGLFWLLQCMRELSRSFQLNERIWKSMREFPFICKPTLFEPWFTYLKINGCLWNTTVCPRWQQSRKSYF